MCFLTGSVDSSGSMMLPCYWTLTLILSPTAWQSTAGRDVSRHRYGKLTL